MNKLLRAILLSFLLDGNDEPLLDRVGGRLTDPAIYETGSRAVLVAELRYPAVELPTDGSRPPPPGTIYRQWFQMIITRQFFPLFP